MATKRSPYMERHVFIDHAAKAGCQGRLWIFLLLGLIVFILGIIICGIYFNIQTLTSTGDLTEVIPTYINAGVVLVTGLITAVLFWQRWKYLVFLCVVSCVAAGFLCGITSILTGTHIIELIESFSACHYYSITSTCQCYSPYSKTALHLEYSETEQESYIFDDASTCDSIQQVLPQLLYALSAVYALVFVFCCGSAFLSLLILRQERIRKGFFEDETLDDVYTVSGGSASPISLDSDAHLDSPPTNIPANICMESHAAASIQSCVNPNGQSGIRRTKSFTQPRHYYDEESVNENIDNSGYKTDVEEFYGKSKLKEHRKKNRRAVTLHNLDRNQLMLILSLQMRYMQESDGIKQSNYQPQLQHHPHKRRALTPTPRLSDSSEPSIQRQVRSHTPQPYHSKHNNHYNNTQENSETNMFNQVLQVSGMRKNGTCVTNYEEIDDVFIPPEPSMAKTLHEKSVSSQLQRNYPSDLPPQPISRTAQNNTQLPVIPVSRYGVKDGILPPVPLHRSKSSDDSRVLPPVPFHRSASTDPHNIHNGSAFQIVSSDKNNINLKEKSDVYSTAQYPTAEQAINFQLEDRFMKSSFQGPYIDSHIYPLPESGDGANILPPYQPPPTYKDHVSNSCEGSVSSSVSGQRDSEDVYTEIIPRHNRNGNFPSEENDVDMSNFYGVPNSNFPLIPTFCEEDHQRKAMNRQSLKKALDGEFQMDDLPRAGYLDSMV